MRRARRVTAKKAVPEPTQLNVVVAHKGAARWKCSTLGRATHSSQPHLGDNAIFHMARVLAVVQRKLVKQYGNFSDESTW